MKRERLMGVKLGVMLGVIVGLGVMLGVMLGLVSMLNVVLGDMLGLVVMVGVAAGVLAGVAAAVGLGEKATTVLCPVTAAADSLSLRMALPAMDTAIIAMPSRRPIFTVRAEGKLAAGT